jgi:hypothetical protein
MKLGHVSMLVKFSFDEVHLLVYEFIYLFLFMIITCNSLLSVHFPPLISLVSPAWQGGGGAREKVRSDYCARVFVSSYSSIYPDAKHQSRYLDY